MIQMNQFVGRNRDTEVENKCMDTKGGKPRWSGGGGVMNWEIGSDMYTLMCIRLMTNKNLLYIKIKLKKKKRLRNCSRIKKTKETKCNVRSWTEFWTRNKKAIKDITPTNGEI